MPVAAVEASPAASPSPLAVAAVVEGVDAAALVLVLVAYELDVATAVSA